MISVADQIFLTLGVLIFAGIFFCVGLSLHLAYTKMEVMLGYLSNCIVVKTHAPLNDGGPWGKLMLVGWIAGVLAFPSYYLRRGEADIKDLNNFPVRLRKKLIVLKWSSIVLLIAMIVLFVLRKSGLLK